MWHRHTKYGGSTGSCAGLDRLVVVERLQLILMEARARIRLNKSSVPLTVGRVDPSSAVRYY